MSVNQRIKKAMKRGDMAKVARILDLSHQAVADRIKSEKQIDSVDFINACVQVTGHPFEHFKAIAKVPGKGKIMQITHHADPEDAYSIDRIQSEMDAVALQNACLYWMDQAKKLDRMISKLLDFIDKIEKGGSESLVTDLDLQQRFNELVEVYESQKIYIRNLEDEIQKKRKKNKN